MSDQNTDAIKAAYATLHILGYSYDGGLLWKGPGTIPDPDMVRAINIMYEGDAQMAALELTKVIDARIQLHLHVAAGK